MIALPTIEGSGRDGAQGRGVRCRLGRATLPNKRRNVDLEFASVGDRDEGRLSSGCSVGKRGGNWRTPAYTIMGTGWDGASISRDSRRDGTQSPEDRTPLPKSCGLNSGGQRVRAGRRACFVVCGARCAARENLVLTKRCQPGSGALREEFKRLPYLAALHPQKMENVRGKVRGQGSSKCSGE